MRAELSLLLVAFGHLCAAAAAQERPTTVPPLNVASSQIYITHVTVIDTETGKEAKDRTVVISGERISKVRGSKGVRPSKDAKVVDAKGKYLIPGLWDMHTHAVRQETVASMFPMFVANAVLGIRDMGSPMNLADIDRLRKEVTTGSRLGPRIVAAGPILDGHEKPLYPMAVAITTAEQGRETVRSLKTGGADFVKVYSWLSRDSFLAIADEARKQGLPYGGHVPFSVSALEASDAGQKSMEHLFGIALACSVREEEIRNELVKGGISVTLPALNHLEIEEAGASYNEKKAARVFAHLAKNQTWQVPTFAADLPDSRAFDVRVTSDPRQRYIPPSVQERWSKRAASVGGSSPWGKFSEQRQRMLGAMHRAGVPVLAGTDTAWGLPYTYAGFSLHDELALLVQAGLTPLESLQTATINPARFFQRTVDFGTIEKGKLADLVLLDADPLQDIHNTKKILEVFLGGKEFNRTALDQMLSNAEAAAKAAPPEHAVLVDNIGTYGRIISTSSPLAQKFFDQGLRLVYGYYFPEAIASFYQAQQYDADHPMLDWGLALAMGPNPNSRKNSFPDDPHGDGKKAMANARAHLTRATPAERALIEALSVRYDAEQYPDRAVRDEKFIAATKSVLDRFPDDMEAQFLFADAVMIRGAWNYWQRDGLPLPGTREAAAALEHIMALEPNHPGAVHLYVHLFEASAEPERALPHADRLESTMPKAGHMVHMPSHIYVRLGQYEKAVASNERSVAVDHFFLSQWGNLPFPQEGTYHTSASTHAPHALDVLRQAAMLQGNYARALEAAHRMAGGHSLMAANPRQQRLPPAWLVHKAFGRWQALLAEPAPSADRLYLNAAWRYFRGSSFAGLGDFEKADSELQALSAIARDPALKDIVSGANSAPSLVSMLTSAITGEVAMRRGRYAEAVTAFEQAVNAQDALNYDEPPDWLQPMRLYLGATLLKAGRAKDAEAVYREELHDLHENGWALFGLWQSVTAQGRTTEAREIRERFDRAWKDADVVLSASVF